MTAPSIQIKNISLTLAGNNLFEKLNCTLEAGKLHVIIGPNGAGKTSLLKSMLGLLPYRGSIERTWSGKIYPAAYIPQQPRFETVLPVTVQDYLVGSTSNRCLIFKPNKDQVAKIEPLLEKVGLSNKAKHQLGKLSGGERQRLMFAQALSLNSPLWFLDEPTTGLDEQGLEFFTQFLAELKADQKTIIMVHHDMEFVKRWADNILILNNGLQKTGPPNIIFTDELSTEAPAWMH